MVNVVETLIQSIPSYRKLIEDEMEQQYLSLHIERPPIEEDKLRLLHVLLAKQDDIEDSVVSVMLVQIALDTHDLIVQNTSEDPEERKKQQLTVLAGDFYSGLYYKRLADINNIPLTGVLADGISDITEQKMNFFYTTFEEPTQFAQDFCELDFVLIKHLAYYTNWNDKEDHFFMKNWLFYKRLLQESVALKENKPTLFRNLFERNVKDTDFESFLQKEINKRKKSIEESHSKMKQYVS